jgi:hypothetical protein
MCAAATWEMVPATAEAGQQSALQIVDRHDNPDGRTVCIIPGNLKRRLNDGNFTRLLDEQDVANAAMILLLPQFRNTMFRLVEWAARTGGWDAPSWRSAEALVKQLREIGGDA